MPETIRGEPALTKYKSVDDLAAGFLSAQKLIGAKGIIPPGRDATPEEVNAFQVALGRPEKVEGYTLPTPKEVAGMADLSEPVRQEFAKVAFEAGLSAKQASALYQKWATSAAQGTEQQQQQIQAEVESGTAVLKKDWGQAFDQNVKLTRDAIDQFGGKEVMDALTATGALRNPAIVKAFAKIGRALLDDDVHGRGRSTAMESSPEESLAQIAAMRGDKAFVTLLRAGDTGAQAKWDKAFKAAYPEPDK